MALRLGKLPLALQEEILALRGAEDPGVHLGPAIGEDAAVVVMGEEYLVLTTDPITFAQEEIGWYAVHANANDVATRGARPRWFQAALLFPPGTTASVVRGVVRQIHEACKELDIAVTGGHSEVTDAVDRVVVVGDLQGTVPRGRLVTTGGAQEGDDLILTKAAGIEGTALLARARGEELVQEFGETFVARAANFLRNPGLSVVPEARLAADKGAHAMHDPTEGGVAMSLLEMSHASGRVLHVTPATIPVQEETEAICAHFGLTPFGLLASGALAIAMPPEKTASLLDLLEGEGIPGARVGLVGDRGVGVQVDGATPHAFEPSERDEVARVLSDEKA
ncbi:MAG: AIR synthase family protein [Thermoplasmata archaeon]